MRKKFIVRLSILALLMTSCSLFEKKDDSNINPGILSGNGVFLINEGNFLAGNGSLSYYSMVSEKIYNDIFSMVNLRPLGDVPNSMTITGDTAFIVVNNSGKIEVIETETAKSIKTIKDLISPRNLVPVGLNKAYLTSLYSEFITIIDLKKCEITGSINIRRSSEAIVVSGRRAIISNWSSGNEILIVDIDNDKLIDSVRVGSEPESMVRDREGTIWIMCSGSYMGNTFPELIRFNPDNKEIMKRFIFPSRSMYPSTLRINNTLDTLYFIESSIWKMGIESNGLPELPFISASGRNFYKLGVSAEDGDLFATNAGDYQTAGYLLRFSRGGALIDSVRTDILPGFICSKQKGY